MDLNEIGWTEFFWLSVRTGGERLLRKDSAA
jgi:hypothetical protein